MLNQSLLKHVESVVFNIGQPPYTMHSDDLKRLKADKSYSLVEAIPQQYVRIQLANP
jgi:hypothetical protein